MTSPPETVGAMTARHVTEANAWWGRTLSMDEKIECAFRHARELATLALAWQARAQAMQGERDQAYERAAQELNGFIEHARKNYQTILADGLIDAQEAILALKGTP